MNKRKTLPLVLGMTMMISWGTLTAQASPQQYEPGYTAITMLSFHDNDHRLSYRPTPKEYDQLLDVLKIDQRTFIWEMRRDQSLADIADRQDVSEKKIIRLVERQLKNHIEDDKRDGRISERRADYLKKYIKDSAKAIVHDRSLNLRDFPIRHYYHYDR